jgi:hypothetical protein
MIPTRSPVISTEPPVPALCFASTVPLTIASFTARNTILPFSPTTAAFALTVPSFRTSPP